MSRLKKISELACFDAEVHALSHLKRILKQHGHRQLMLLRGDKCWCKQVVSEYLLTGKELILSDSDQFNGAIWPHHMHQLLGQEFSDVIYDGYSGLSPDKLGAIAGTILPGGLLILIFPESADTDNLIDPDWQRFQSFSENDSIHPTSWFNRRFNRLLTTLDPIIWSQADGLLIPEFNQYESEQCVDVTGPAQYDEQQAVIQAIQKLSTGRANRPLVIQADRGRGKSAALGIAAATMAIKGKTVIFVAAQKKSLITAEKHFDDTIGTPEFSFHFCPPDHLLQHQPEADIILVDEAATIPVPSLVAIVKQYPRVVFSTTVQGYEGTGRGFSLRFAKHLNLHYPQARFISMHKPIRYHSNDPLETSVNRLLKFDSVLYPIADFSCTEVSSLTFMSVTQQQLSEDEHLLHQVFSILVLAHYQTSANDLRHLLDANHCQIFVAMHKQNVVSAVLLSSEGQFNSELSAAITQNQRRPKGHMLPQLLAQQFQHEALAHYRYARIIRIAVHPELQGLGIGSQVLDFVEQRIKSDFDFIGASFGAQSQLLKFWQRHHYQFARLGYRKDHATGEHAALILKPLSTRSEQAIAPHIEAYFEELPYMILTQFSHLDTSLIQKFLVQKAMMRAESTIGHIDISRLAWQLSALNLDSLQSKLWHHIWQYPQSLLSLSDTAQHLLIKKLFQNKPAIELINHFQYSGKKELNQALKNAVKQLLTYKSACSE